MQRILDLLGLWVVSGHHDSAGTAASAPTAVFGAGEVDWKEGGQGKEGPRLLCFLYFSSSLGIIPEIGAIIRNLSSILNHQCLLLGRDIKTAPPAPCLPGNRIQSYTFETNPLFQYYVRLAPGGRRG